MPTFVFDKLVRDKTIERLHALGFAVQSKQLSADEHLQGLKNKLIEEAREVADAQDAQELLSELADVYEVLETLLRVSGVSRQQIQQQQQQRRAQRGGFEQGIKVEQVQLPNGDLSPQLAKWLHYYRQQPDRYPEIADHEEH